MNHYHHHYHHVLRPLQDEGPLQLLAVYILRIIDKCSVARVGEAVWKSFRYSHPLCERHRVFYNVQRRLLADRSSGLTSIRWTAHTLLPCPACETPMWQFIAVSGFKPRLDSSKGSAQPSKALPPTPH